MGYFATQAEIAALIGCNPSHISQLKTAGKIPREFLQNKKSGGRMRTRIHTDFADFYLQNREEPRKSGPVPAPGSANYAIEKQKAELSKLILQSQRLKLDLEEKQSLLVPKNEFENTLAERARIFRQDLETMARTNAADIVNIAEGKPEMVPNVIDFMLKMIYKFLERYSK